MVGKEFEEHKINKIKEIKADIEYHTRKLKDAQMQLRIYEV